MADMTKECLRDLAKHHGLKYNQQSHEMTKPELEKHMLKAHTFAASLRAKHPSSFERGDSTRGDWWGFPGDFQILDPGDLETEASLSGVNLTHWNP